jgi:hypothetical protein
MTGRKSVSMFRTQKGVLRRKNLTKVPTIPDHRAAEIEFEPNPTPYISSETGPGVHIVNVKADDGQAIEDGDYLFIVTGDGFFQHVVNLILTKQDGRWRQV